MSRAMLSGVWGLWLVSQALGQQPVRLEVLAIRDPMVNNEVAATMLKPVGWQARGGIQWHHTRSNLATAHLWIGSPDQRVALEAFPIVPCTWQEGGIAFFPPGSTYLGNHVAEPIHDAAQYLQVAILPLYRQGIPMRLVGRQPLPGVAEAVWHSVAEQGVRKHVVAQRVRAEYAVHDVEFEEDFYVVLVFAVSDMLPGATLWQANQQYAFRAPKGELDRYTPLLQAMVSSVRVQPGWYGQYLQVVQMWMNNQRQAIADAGALSRYITQTNREINDTIMAAYENQQRTQDRIHSQFSKSLRGVETYGSPYTGRTLELPSGYNDVWVSQTGEVILSNQSGFDPNVGSTVNWQRAQAQGQ